jgi:hypothetical protein
MTKEQAQELYHKLADISSVSMSAQGFLDETYCILNQLMTDVERLQAEVIKLKGDAE